MQWAWRYDVTTINNNSNVPFCDVCSFKLQIYVLVHYRLFFFFLNKPPCILYQPILKTLKLFVIKLLSTNDDNTLVVLFLRFEFSIIIMWNEGIIRKYYILWFKFKVSLILLPWVNYYYKSICFCDGDGDGSSMLSWFTGLWIGFVLDRIIAFCRLKKLWDTCFIEQAVTQSEIYVIYYYIINVFYTLFHNFIWW